jgi:hypothetical protein
MSTRSLIVAFVVVALLALGWLWTSPRTSQNAIAPPMSSPIPAAPPTPAPPAAKEAAPSAVPSTGRAASPEAAPSIQHFQVIVANSKPGIGAPPLKTTQGDSVTIDISSDRPGTVEIHGYGKKIDVAPGSVATLSFIANIAGRFPVDLHGRDGRHVDVTALEVQPR